MNENPIDLLNPRGLIPPPPDIPHFQTPDILGLPHLPLMGCIMGTGTFYSGRQHGDRPHNKVIDQIKHYRQTLLDEIETLIDGQLDNPLRAARFAQKVIDYVDRIANFVQKLNDAIGKVLTEINEDLAFTNQTQQELTAELNKLMAVPETARTELEKLGVTRYNEYLGKLSAQVGRLQGLVNCVVG
jgi:hypothetical protein